MSNENAPNDKEMNPVDTEQLSSGNHNPEPQLLWIERLDACLTDEFRFRLNEVMTKTMWLEVKHGAWNDPIEFFKYLDRQVEIVYRLKKSPSVLRSHFVLINPSLKPYPYNGGASWAARENLPVIRQQVFLINALRIIIKKRFENDQSLRLALSVLKDLLHQKIIESLHNLGMMVQNPEWYYLTNRVGQHSDLKFQAYAIYDFLSEIIEKNNIKSKDDRRDTLLFVKEQLEIPYEVTIQNNNIITTAFGDNEKLKSLCTSLYYEYYRLIYLANLEGLQQNDLLGEPKSQTQESDELPTDTSQKKEKTRGYPPHYLEQIIHTAAKLYEEKDNVRASDIYTELRIEKNTYNKRIKHFGYDTAKILYEARARNKAREGMKSIKKY